jgi:hypothetical protein
MNSLRSLQGFLALLSVCAGCTRPLSQNACANHDSGWCGAGRLCEQGPGWSRCVSAGVAFDAEPPDGPGPTQDASTDGAAALDATAETPIDGSGMVPRDGFTELDAPFLDAGSVDVLVDSYSIDVSANLMVDSYSIDVSPDLSAPDAGLLTECSVGQSRPCYNGVAGTAGVGICKSGTQLCNPNGRWAATCVGEVTPQAESCNQTDDNCDGTIDNISPRTRYIWPLNVSELTAKDAACDPTQPATWPACNRAIHLYCRDMACRTAGLGPLGYFQGMVDVACLTTDAPLIVTAGDLAGFGSCPLANQTGSDLFECAKTIGGFCKSKGYAAGFGPVALPGGAQATLVCLRPGHAIEVATTYAILATFQSGCTGLPSARLNPTQCYNAALRFCTSKGYLAGYGPVADPDGASPSVVCLDK